MSGPRLRLAVLALVCTVAPAGAGDDAVDLHGDPLPRGAGARLGTLRLRHAGVVTCVAYSPDGTLLASSAQDGTIRLWDPATGKELRRITGHKAGISTFAFSATGKQIISASSHHLEWFPDGSFMGASDHFVIRLWDVASGRALRSFKGHESEISSLACSRDGNVVVSATRNGDVWTWELDRDEPVHKLRPHNGWMATHVALSPDDKVLATAGGDDGRVKLFDLASGQELRSWRASPEAVTAVAFTPDGSLIATGDSQRIRRVKLWNVATGELDRDLGPQLDNTSSFGFSRDGARMVSGSVSHQTANIWDLRNKRLIRTHWTKPPIPSGFRWVALSPDGATLAAAHGDNMIRLWDVATGNLKLPGAGHTGDVMGLAFHPSGKLVATGDKHAAWRLWDVATREEVHCCTDLNRAASDIAFSPDGQLLAAGGHFSSFGIWDVASKKVIGKAGWGTYFSLAFVPERAGKDPAPFRLAAAHPNKRSVDIHDPFTGRELKQLTFGITGGVYAIACSPDGRLLAACAGRSSGVPVHVVDLTDDRHLFLLKHDAGGVSSVAFSPDGTLLATVSDGQRGQTCHACLWSTRTGAEVARLAAEVHAQKPPMYGPRRQVAFSPDGKLLAVTGRDGAVRLFDVKTHRELRRLDGGQGGIWRLAFSPDSSLLATAGCDTTVLLWTVGTKPPDGPDDELTDIFWAPFFGPLGRFVRKKIDFAFVVRYKPVITFICRSTRLQRTSRRRR
jgi:WD40 repeat protein